MNFFVVLVLSVVQGLTEFLPVSSSGHLVILQKLFGLSQPPVFFDVLLHMGTLISIIVFFKKELIELVVYREKNKKTWLALIVGSIPVAILGYLLNSKIEEIFNSLTLVGASMIVCGLVLLSTKFAKRTKSIDTPEKISWVKAFVVGLFQSIALLPGISRSGSTISGGLWQGLSSETAFKFSFLLSIPAILGAVLLKAKGASFSDVSIGFSILGVLISAFFGFFALRFLQKILESEKFWLFSFYCFTLGLIVLLAW